MNMADTLLQVIAPINYKGCIILNKENAFYALGKPHSTIQQAKSFIDNAFKIDFNIKNMSDVHEAHSATMHNLLS